MANVNHVDIAVTARQEQVQQDVEAFRDILGFLVHRAGDVHQAEHYRLRGRLGALHEIIETHIEGIDKRNLANALAQRFDFLAQFGDSRRVGAGIFQGLQLRFQFVQAAARFGAHGDAPR